MGGSKRAGAEEERPSKVELEIPSRQHPWASLVTKAKTEHMFCVDSGPLIKTAPVKNSLIKGKVVR